MLKSGDEVTAQSLTESGTTPHKLQGILEIIKVEEDDIYPAFKAYFVDGQEADISTIKILTDTVRASSKVLLDLEPEQEQKKEKGHYSERFSTPYDRFTDVFEAAEKLSGNFSYGERGHGHYFSDVIRQAYNIVNNEKPNFKEDRDYYKDAAILLAAIPKSPKTGTLYRGTAAYEISKTRDEIQPGHSFDLPLAKFSPDMSKAMEQAKGIILRIESPIPWIETKPVALSTPREGFCSARFRVTGIYRMMNYDLTIIGIIPISNYETLAEQALLTNGWDFGEDHLALTAAAYLKLPTLSLEFDNYFKAFSKYFSEPEQPEKVVLQEEEDDNFDLTDPVNFVKESFDKFLNLFQPKAYTSFINTCHAPDTGQFCETTGVKNFGFEGWDEERKLTIFRTVKRLQDKYGIEVTINAKYDQFNTAMSNDALAAVDSAAPRTIDLAPNMKDPQWHKDNAPEAEFMVDTSLESLIIHEYGHVLDEDMQVTEHPRWAELAEPFNEVKDSYGDLIMGKNDKGAKYLHFVSKVSEYGSSYPWEGVAESFLQYELGEKNEYSDHTGKIFEEVFRSNDSRKRK